jgi:ABC-2 type transport system ATP-binding protein
VSAPFIEVRGLRVVYRSGAFGRKKFEAVKGLDLEVGPGAIFGFLGPNGAGKTSALLAMLDLLKSTGGEARLFGLPLSEREAVFSRVGYLPEEFNFHQFLTGEELLRFHGRLQKMEPARLEQRVGETLAQMQLSDFRRAKVKTYSKGMKQRLGIAQAVLHDPDLLFLDEPTRGLDPIGAKIVRDAVVDMARRGKTVFLNSHVLAEVEQVCTHVAVMHQGRKAWEGNPAAIPGSGAGFTAAFVSEPGPWLDAYAPEASGGELRAKLADIPALLKFLEALDAAGGRLHAVTASRRSLEEHFVSLVTA